MPPDELEHAPICDREDCPRTSTTTRGAHYLCDEHAAERDGRERAANVAIDLVLAPGQALALAQLVKRITFTELSANAVDRDEAYVMRDALEHLRDALAARGFAPR